jgi:hypothetical protein
MGNVVTGGAGLPAHLPTSTAGIGSPGNGTEPTDGHDPAAAATEAVVEPAPEPAKASTDG